MPGPASYVPQLDVKDKGYNFVFNSATKRNNDLNGNFYYKKKLLPQINIMWISIPFKKMLNKLFRVIPH